MIEQLNSIADLWWTWTVAMFWQVGVLIVLIACIDRLTRRWTWPQLRYALWSLVLIKLVLPPTLSLPVSIAPKVAPAVAQVLSATTDETTPAPERASSDRRMGNLFAHADPANNGDETAWASELPILPAATEGGTAPGHQEVSASVGSGVQGTPYAFANPQSEIYHVPLTWRFYVMSLWLAGSVFLAVFLTLRLRSLSRADRSASKATPLPESFYNQLSGCAGRLGLHRVPRVVATDSVACPAVFGVFRPVLLMPRGYLVRLSRRDTEHMLLHELSHVKRGDLLAHGFYMLLQIVYWYNPLLWLVRRQVHHLRELCCDATVASLLRENTGAYRQTLLDTARRFLATRTEPGLGLLGLFEDSNRLLIRLNWLEKPTWRYKNMKRAIVIAIVGLMLACVLPMAQSQTTPTVEDPEVLATDATETATVEATPEQHAERLERATEMPARNQDEMERDIAVAGLLDRQPEISSDKFTAQMKDLQRQSELRSQKQKELSLRIQQIEAQLAQLEQQPSESPEKDAVLMENLRGRLQVMQQARQAVQKSIQEVHELMAQLERQHPPVFEQAVPGVEQLQAQVEQLRQERRKLQKSADAGRQIVMEREKRQAGLIEDPEDGRVYQVYHVRPGDTLAAIAERFSDAGEDAQDLTIAEILEANYLDPDQIQVGNLLRIPLSPRQALQRQLELKVIQQEAENASRALALNEAALARAERDLSAARSRLTEARALDLRAEVQGRGTTSAATNRTSTAGSTARETTRQVPEREVRGRATARASRATARSEVPNADQVVDITLPSEMSVSNLAGLVGRFTNLDFLYDPQEVAGLVALELHGPSDGSLTVAQLYQLLESALEVKNLTMSRRGDNIVVIVPRDETPHTSLFDITSLEASPAPALTAQAAVDGDYVVKSIQPRTTLNVQNNVGSVKIQGGPGRDCAIKVKIEAKGATPELAEEIAQQVVVQVTPIEGRVNIGVQFPDEIDKQQRDNIQVHFDMVVPQDIPINVQQKVGDVHLANLSLYDGKFPPRFVVTDVGDIQTQNVHGNVRFRANVGDIDVILPPDASGSVRATAQVGGIESDLPLNITSASVVRAGDAQGALGSSATGEVGSGDSTLNLELTTNVGSIRIRSASAADSPGS